MQLQEPTDQLTGVAETLMITLYAYAIEAQQPEPILSVHGVCAKHNRKAVKIAESLDYDFSKYGKGWALQLGCVIWARACDRIVNIVETVLNSLCYRRN